MFTRDKETPPAKRDFLELDTPPLRLGQGEPGQRYIDDAHGEFGITPGRLDDFESPLEVDEDTPSPPSSSDTHYTTEPEPEPVLQPGSVLGGEVKLVKALGRGAFSTVWLGERGGNVVAVKVAPSDDRVTRSSYEREAEIIKVRFFILHAERHSVFKYPFYIAHTPSADNPSAFYNTFTTCASAAVYARL